MSYQKVYMNQIYSSSLMGQLAQMWRNQLLCDAVIKTGNVNTKAHRLVMIAACPMLQHMENAAIGSHLEVRLSADIKQESVLAFLQYLYEGFMKLTEDNCRDVEKMGKLLHVDSVVKCCADFYKCLNAKTGVASFDGSKFDSQDHVEFKHVRCTDIEKTLHETALKRSSEMPPSPGGKRQRVSRPSTPPMGHRSDDRFSMSHSYASQDYFDSSPRHGANTQYQRPAGVIETVNDGVEVISSDPPERDSDGWPKDSDLPPVQHSMGISVSGQVTNETDLQIINVEQIQPPRRSSANTLHTDTGQRRMDTSAVGVNQNQRHQRQTQIQQESIYIGHSQTRGGVASESPKHSDQYSAVQTSPFRPQYESSPVPPKTPTQPHPLKSAPVSHSKPFAAGSMSQVQTSSQSFTQDSITSQSQIRSSPQSVFPNQQTTTLMSGGQTEVRPGQDIGQVPQSVREDRLQPPDTIAGGTSSSVSSGKSEAQDSTDDLGDITIVKVEEAVDTGGLDMFVDMPEDKSSLPRGEAEEGGGVGEDTELEESGEWSRDEYSNEGSSFSAEPGTSGQGDGSSSKGPGGVTDNRITGYRHTQRHGKEYPMLNPQSSDFTNPQNSCRICYRTFPDKSAVEEHHKQVNNHGYARICSLCGKPFKSTHGYKVHLKIMHGILGSSSLYRCKICLKPFSARSNLMAHMTKHSNHKPYQCKICGKAYKIQKSLILHSKTCT